MRARPKTGVGGLSNLPCHINLLLLRPPVVAVAVPLPPLTLAGPLTSDTLLAFYWFHISPLIMREAPRSAISRGKRWSLALGSVTSSTANSQSLRAIKRACLCGRQLVDLLPPRAMSLQLGRHVVDKHAGARDGHHDACSPIILLVQYQSGLHGPLLTCTCL